jgi:hypothetical protein
MANVSVVKLKVRRGTDAQRKLITLDTGEIGFVTDTGAQRLFVGDGTTRGGISTTMKFFYGSFTAPISFERAQVGDLIYNTDDTKLYVLTGTSGGFPNYNSPAAFQYIGPSVDNRTIEYNLAGNLQVESQGLSATHLSWNCIDRTQGLTKGSSLGPLRVNYDSVSIKTTVGGALYVDLANVNAGALPATNPGPGKLWNDGGIVKVGT